ncbi:unnamed protein product [Adineta steineri]|uniref:Uncharacterized protein n=1 Tax=Adineta steineri TaxID=433720 RepID=A0A814JQY3_9BILA|nr:unnamed protein product [Adineta steineri]CAF0825588.1 unnamed protein product [Adineta steineri]CAF1040610.1 unnamed protein product [Adineta steineri]
MTELVMKDGVMELSQAFSPLRDTIATSSKLGTIQLYSNFITNEQFEVTYSTVAQQQIPVCSRQVIAPQSETSVVRRDTLILKPSVLLGFDARNQWNLHWGLRYDGDETLRGIPANRFKSCFYVDDIKATVSATYHVSDIEKFQAYLPANQSIILQIDVTVTNPRQNIESYTYNVFHYAPNPSRREDRQALETPTGVFCPNRTSTFPVPSNIPDRVSTNVETFIPTLNNSIFSTHSLYDNDFQFTRIDTWYPDPLGGLQWLHASEIHDFVTGLNYHYNSTTGQCIVRDITLNDNDAIVVDGKPSFVQMSSVQHFFLMDDSSYHYTGEKPCGDHVWCHVWIGEKLLTNNIVQQRELYWALAIHGEPLIHSIPMKLVLKNYANGIPVFTAEENIFNFRRNQMTSFEIDHMLADCYRALGPEENYNLGVISFTVANDNEYPVQENIDHLRHTIWQTLITILQVRSIRISNIIVDRDGKDLPVTFTLLDVPPRLGPVEILLQEPSLITAIERLRAVIDAHALIFRAKYGTKEVILRARINSLHVIYTSFDQNSNQCFNQTFARSQNPEECPDTTTEQNLNQNIDIVYLSSGPLITGFWIGFIILGLFVGIVGGFFVLKRFF